MEAYTDGRITLADHQMNEILCREVDYIVSPFKLWPGQTIELQSQETKRLAAHADMTEHRYSAIITAKTPVTHGTGLATDVLHIYRIILVQDIPSAIRNLIDEYADQNERLREQVAKLTIAIGERRYSKQGVAA